MPAFGKRLGRRQIDDLVAYVMAVSGGISPEEGSAAALGLERAKRPPVWMEVSAWHETATWASIWTSRKLAMPVGWR
jgi:hypothetical protein